MLRAPTLLAALVCLLRVSSSSDSGTCSATATSMTAGAKQYAVGGARLVLQQGDITKWTGDAIVNAGRGERVVVVVADFRSESPL